MRCWCSGTREVEQGLEAIVSARESFRRSLGMLRAFCRGRWRK